MIGVGSHIGSLFKLYCSTSFAMYQATISHLDNTHTPSVVGDLSGLLELPRKLDALSTPSPPGQPLEVGTALSGCVIVILQLWHNRLGHIERQHLMMMAQGLVNRLELSSSD